MTKGKKPQDEDEGSEEGGPKSSFEVYRAEADMLYKIGQYRKAIESYSTALELRQDDKYCLVARAKCYLHLGNSIEALQDAETSLKEEPEFPRGLFMKAEALYQMGKFEMALVYYHRGFNNRPEMHEFKVGIQKAEEAINNSIGPGNCGKLKRIEGVDLLDPDEDKKTRGTRRPAPAQTGQGRLLISSQKNETKSAASDKASKLLLGQLYQDKQFLGDLLREEENRPVKHAKMHKSQVKELCSDGLSYLDNRTEFWRQQKPVSQRAKARREAAGRTTQGTRDMYLSRLADIDASFHRGDYDGALSAARKLESQVMKEPDVTFQYKPEIIAFIDHFIGNCLLEKGDHNKAMEYFNKERTYGEESNIPEAKSRAYDDIGRTYARMGDYNKAIDIWNQKLNGQTCSLLAQTWLCHEIGRCFYELGNFPTALEHAGKALDAAKTESNRPWMLNCNILAAQTYIQMEKFENALEQFDQAFDLSEGNEEVRKSVKAAIEQLTKRIREENKPQLEDVVITTYRVSASLSSLQYSEGSYSGNASIELVGDDGKTTGLLGLGTFSQADNPSSVELSHEPAHQRISKMQRADLWISGLDSYVVDSLSVYDDGIAQSWKFDLQNGTWATHDEDASKRVWRMTALD